MMERPSGTSGRPVLAVLQGSGLGDAAIVVTRYFGGTKLGIGGLVHAYSDAAKSILEILPGQKRFLPIQRCLQFHIHFFERTRLLLAKWKAEKLDEAFGIDVMITSRFLIDHFEGFQKDFSELTSGQDKSRNY